MSIKNSIIYPILGVLALLISLATIFHYFAQISLLEDTVKIKEEIRSKDIQFAIQTLINKETDKLSSLAKALKEQDELVWEIAYYPNSEDNITYIKEVMDRIYKGLNVGVFIATDKEGRIIYQAHKPDERGNLADYWGIAEVLDGRDMVVTEDSVAGWSILSMAPAMRDNNLYGAIIIGTIIDNQFANSIADATDVEVSFGSSSGIFASSASSNLTEKYVIQDVFISSLAEERKIFLDKPSVSTAIFYAPVRVIDEIFILIVEMDLSDSQMLLTKYQRQIALTSLFLLLFALIVGAILTLYHVRPVKQLTEQAEKIANELSGEKITIAGGNEIQHLVRSFEVLVETVEKYARQRIQAEENLVDEKERLTVTLQSIGDAVISTDNSGMIILINSVAEELTGWRNGTAIGQPLVKVFNTLDEKTRKPSEDFVAKVLEAERIIDKNRPTILMSSDGSERIISEVGAPIRDDKDRIIGVVLVFSDITDRLKVEEELLKGKKLESVGILAGGIAHDFNNILTAIMGNISLAKNYIDPENRAFKRLEEADRATIRAKDLTHKLLTFSKGGAPVKKTASIEELIRESTSFTLSGTSVKTMFSFADDMWFVDIDTGQISQVIQNLCLNASQAMPDGGLIWIGVENETIADETTLPLAPGKYLKISFKDTGVGISQKNLTRIFDPYFTTKQKGSGLGLATVYSIINNHDGCIKVNSELDVGTTFTFYLPASDKLYDSVTQEQYQQGDEYKGEGRILVMDDEEIVREVAGEMLSHIGFEVDFAVHGEEALEKYADAKRNGKPFDVVIMDLTVPGGMGGADAIKKLLEIDPKANAIVSSGYSNNPVMSKYKEYGFVGVVSKPFHLDEIAQPLQDILKSES
jgi:PAS domain S-box-containing protein